jgi:thiol:disulfide interchange protein DsbD
MKYLLYIPLLASLLLATLTSYAQSNFIGDSEQPPTSSLMASANSFLPVEQVYQVAVSIEDRHILFNWSIVDNYYLYRDRFKFNAVDPTTQLQEPLFETGKRKYDEFFEEELEVYYGQTTVKVPFTADQGKMEVQIESQGCADAGLCYPPYKQWLTIDVVNNSVVISDTPTAAARTAMQSNTSSQQSQSQSLLWVLGFALLGGMILNLMPCVFPVLSIKVLSFTNTHQTQRQKQAHGLAYTSGVISTFVAIAAIMLSLRAAGEAIGWGFQLQSPLFVVVLIYLFFVMGMALSGYLEIGTSLMSIGQSSKQSDGLSSSFMTGVLATTVASPCTAPFMGPALGFAISQPTFIALLVFAFLGLGMALPFIVLTWIPGLTSKLPKPGPWMDAFKQFLAFPLYMTSVWLLWVVGRQTSVNVVAIVVLGVILVAMAMWLTKLRQSGGKKVTDFTLTNALAAICLITALTAPGLMISKDSEPPLWESYSSQRLSELDQAGQPIFVNLTADWCITCLANERVAFTERFYKLLQDNKIVYLKGDWTNNDPEITKLLNQFQRSGVPLYLVYPAGNESPEVLPQILLESTVIEALNRAKY